METSICRIRTHVLMTIIEGLFHSPQTLNGHVKKGTGSLIQHPGATTVKWSQIGAALTFLSNTPSLTWISLLRFGLIGLRRTSIQNIHIDFTESLE